MELKRDWPSIEDLGEEHFCSVEATVKPMFLNHDIFLKKKQKIRKSDKMGERADYKKPGKPAKGLNFVLSGKGSPLKSYK